MDEFKAKGIGAVVRIVPDPAKDIGFNILSVVHYRRGVRVVTCQTAEEAERASNGAEATSGKTRRFPPPIHPASSSFHRCWPLRFC